MSDRTFPSPASGGTGNRPHNEPETQRRGNDRLDGDRAGNDRAGDDRAGGDRAGGDRVAGDRAGGDRVAGDRPGDDRAVGDQAGGDRATGDRAGNDRAEKVSAGRRCAICGKPVEPRYRPFCSKRCADVDLGRWLGGRYAIPAAEQDDSPDAAAGDVTEPASGDEGTDGGPAGGR